MPGRPQASGLRAHDHETSGAVDPKCREKMPVAPVGEGPHVQGCQEMTPKSVLQSVAR